MHKGKQKKEKVNCKKTKVLSDESKFQTFEPNLKVFGTLHKVSLTQKYDICGVKN